jgi:hypothetical protein
MINDSSVKNESTSSLKDRRFVLHERTGVLADHLIDINAKAYAVSIRLNGISEAKIDSDTNLSVSKVVTRVN